MAGLTIPTTEPAYLTVGPPTSRSALVALSFQGGLQLSSRVDEVTSQQAFRLAI